MASKKRRRKNASNRSVIPPTRPDVVTTIGPADTGVIGSKIIKETEDALRGVETGKHIAETEEYKINLDDFDIIIPDEEIKKEDSKEDLIEDSNKESQKESIEDSEEKVLDNTEENENDSLIGDLVEDTSSEDISEIAHKEDGAVEASLPEAEYFDEPDEPEYYDEPDAIEYVDRVRSYDTTDIINLNLPEAPLPEIDAQVPEIDAPLSEIEAPIIEDNNIQDTYEAENLVNEPAEIEAPKGKRKSARSYIFLRIIAAVFVFSFTFMLALITGAGLALWDLDKSPSEFARIMNGSYSKTILAGELIEQKAPSDIDAADADDADDDNNLEDESITEDTSDNSEDASLDNQEETLADSENEQQSDLAKDTAIAEQNIRAGMLEMSGIGTIVAAAGNEEINLAEEGMVSGIYNALPENFVSPDTYYPLPSTTVDSSYFDDALFIGDSRMLGFGMYSKLNSTFYCATGFQLYNYDKTPIVPTTNGKVPLFQGIPYNAFTKIYIKVGLNELGWATEEKFEELYGEVIAKLRETQPRAIIYIHAVLPVTAAKSATDSAHTNPKILARNEALRAFAESQKAYFIDVTPVVSGADGSLVPDMTGDGIHLKAQYMDIWKEYLRTHAIVVPQQ